MKTKGRRSSIQMVDIPIYYVMKRTTSVDGSETKPFGFVAE